MDRSFPFVLFKPFSRNDGIDTNPVVQSMISDTCEGLAKFIASVPHKRQEMQSRHI